MVLLGTVVNGIAILIGSIIGLFFSNIQEKYKQTINQGIGLVVLLIGGQMALQVDSVIVLLFSILIGALIGEKMQLENNLNRIGAWVGTKLTQGKENVQLSQAFVTATLLFTVGAMAILGALDSGLRHDHQILYTKSILDGFTSIVLVATLGIGVILSAIPVVLFQGSIATLAMKIEQVFPDLLFEQILVQETAVGGLLIVAIGLNILNVTAIRITNLLPALIIAPLIMTVVYKLG